MATATPPTDETAPSPTADFIVANRPVLGWVLAVLGVAALLVAIWMFTKGLKTTEVPAPAPAPGEAAATEPIRVSNPHRLEWVVGAIGTLWVALDFLGIAAYLLAQLPKPTLAERRTNARMAVLYWGNSLGLGLMVVGSVLFVVWSKAISDAVGGKVAQLVWVAGPILGILLGAGVAFLCCLPARAEERNNVTVRRLIYGSNVALTGMLLVLVLVIGNVIAAVRVPTKLDTTATGFYSLDLNEKTKEYLGKLDQTVRIYSTIPEESDPFTQDTRRLLDAMVAANPARVQVRYLSATVNRDEIARLRAKYPTANLNQYGLLVTTGEDEARFGFIRFQELFDNTRETAAFKGESRVVQELLTIAEGDVKTTIYFTQGSGELSLGSDGPQSRSGQELQRTLEEKKFVVKTLTAAELTKAGGKAKIPDDASMVVVADPTGPLPPSVVTAIQGYLDAERPGGKKGKLLVLTGTHAKLAGGIESTGLEPVLEALGVRASPKFLYSDIQDRVQPLVIAGAAPQAVASGNLVAITYQQLKLPLQNARAVSPVSAGRGPLQATPLFQTLAGIPTWEEDEPIKNPDLAYEELFLGRPGESEAAAQQRLSAVWARKGVSDKGRTVAAVVSEGPTPRALVFGAGEFFSDDTGRAYGQPVQAKIFATLVDWLRDRPSVAEVTNKPYGVYTPNAKPDEIRLVWLPGGLAIVLILSIGAGVWTLRRT